MCGIAGYIGKENGVEYVYSALKDWNIGDTIQPV